MGLLPDEYFRADFGNELPFGFKDFEEALSSIDIDNPPLLSTFKVGGDIYTLVEKDGNLEFVEYEEG